MAKSTEAIQVYLEVGKKKTLAGAIEWPGWCRGAKDEEGALQALIEYAPRYEQVLRAARIPFRVPKSTSELEVIERLDGNASTDFGVPDMAPAVDDDPVDKAELRRLEGLLEACWSALDAAVHAAHGKELRKGPRGGGRELAGVLAHVLGAEESYLTRLGGKRPKHDLDENEQDAIALLNHPRTDDQRRIILDTLGASARGEIDPRGPRGGARWTPRYFVRRAAWHILDHVWEIEDRAS